MEKVIGNIYEIFEEFDKKDIDWFLKKIWLRNNFFNIFSKKHSESYFYNIYLNWKKIAIYDRTYFLDNKEELYNDLTNKEKIIFDCINTTQSDWFKREESLKRIIDKKYKIIPFFVLRLLWSYVIEMQKTIYENIDFLKTDLYYEFIKENKKFKNLIKWRTSSYYNYIPYVKNENLRTSWRNSRKV